MRLGVRVCVRVCVCVCVCVCALCIQAWLQLSGAAVCRGIVLSGVCRATLVQTGTMRPSESWDFETFDSWFFPSNMVRCHCTAAPSSALLGD